MVSPTGSADSQLGSALSDPATGCYACAETTADTEAEMQGERGRRRMESPSATAQVPGPRRESRASVAGGRMKDLTTAHASA